ncbi:MAG: PIG-L family deacetylase [Alphaproteobacteria bacterium]|nr:PIG-L family deacetylase [Alphaproteobacteria bacterium]
MRILAFHAHPDDVEFLSAGTLALLAAKGHHVTIATMTAGDLGSLDGSREETGALRRREAAAAAALIGAGYLCAGAPDLGVFVDDQSRRRAVALIRSANPEIVLTASPSDYHPDHEATSLLVRDGCFAASVPNYDAGDAGPLARIPHLYFMDPIEGRDRTGARVVPDFAVDVSGFMEMKRSMLAKHQSQIEWVRKQHGTEDYLGAMERWTSARGKSAGTSFAEGFRHYTGHPYPREPKLQELAGDALIAMPRAK